MASAEASGISYASGTALHLGILILIFDAYRYPSGHSYYDGVPKVEQVLTS